MNAIRWYPRVTIESNGRGVVLQAGSVLLVQAVCRSGLDTAMSGALEPWRKPRAVLALGKTLLDVALAVAVGGACLADLAVARAEPAVFGPVASDRRQRARPGPRHRFRHQRRDRGSVISSLRGRAAGRSPRGPSMSRNNLMGGRQHPRVRRTSAAMVVGQSSASRPVSPRTSLLVSAAPLRRTHSRTNCVQSVSHGACACTD